MSMDGVHDAIEWLKAARARYGWTTTEAAERIVEQARRSGDDMSLTQQAVSNFENANTKSVPRWMRYARMLVDRLETGEEDRKSGLSEEQRHRLSLIERADAGQLAEIASFLDRSQSFPAHLPIERLGLVPIQSIDLAFGMGGTFTDVPIETEVMHFPAAWVESITLTPPAMLTFARGRGDSMVPTLQDGDMVLIDRSQRTIREQDAIWALTLGDIGMIKRLRIRGAAVSILSDNSNVPTDEAHADEINVVGRVIFIGRRT